MKYKSLGLFFSEKLEKESYNRNKGGDSYVCR